MPDANKHKDLASGLKELDRALFTERAPGQTYARLHTRAAKRVRRQWMGAIAVAAPVCCVLVVVGVRLAGDTPTLEVGGFRVVDTHANARWQEAEGEITLVFGDSTLEVPELRTTLQTRAGTRLRRRNDAIVVLAGEVRFDVAAVESAPTPIRIRVSHGTILVVGTSFSVLQREAGGSVVLHHGSIRFAADRGPMTTLSATGDVLTWPPATARDSAAIQEPEQPADVPERRHPPESKRSPHRDRRPTSSGNGSRLPSPSAPPPKTGESLAVDLAELDELRILKRFPLLVERIRALLPRIEDRGLQESLSYELCEILIHEVRQKTEACTQLAAHADKYPLGRYARPVADARRELECP